VCWLCVDVMLVWCVGALVCTILCCFRLLFCCCLQITIACFLLQLLALFTRFWRLIVRFVLDVGVFFSGLVLLFADVHHENFSPLCAFAVVALGSVKSVVFVLTLSSSSLNIRSSHNTRAHAHNTQNTQHAKHTTHTPVTGAGSSRNATTTHLYSRSCQLAFFQRRWSTLW